jgi:Flp pilus assembly protein CpaB
LKCDKSDKSKLYNEIESLRTTNGTYNVKIHKETFKILEYKYGKIGEKFISKPVEQNQPILEKKIQIEQNQPILEKKIQNDNNVTLKRTLNKQKRRIKYI